MSKESKLIKNAIIYAIGNMSSKVLSYIMVMVYSHYISPSDLGYYDIVLSTVSLLLPIITLEIHEGVYRLMIGKSQYSNNEIVGTSIRFLFVTTLLSTIVLIIAAPLINIKLLPLIIFYLISFVMYTYLQIVVRGCAENKFYAALGIVNSLSALITQFIGIVVLNKGISALFFSLGFANLISVFIVLFRYDFILESIQAKFSKKLLKEVLRYSIPLIPTTICWWVVNACDRYIILFGLGEIYNGIYAISTKFPTIVTTLTSIFYLAWQESAIKEYESEHRDEFFSNIFHKYHRLLISACICCIPATRVVIEMFMSTAYIVAWKYTAPLFIATIYMALGSFLGLGYQISKETAMSTITSIIAALVNVTVNILLINRIGLFAASISTLISYFVMFIIRVKQTKKYFIINYRIKELIIGPTVCILLAISTFVFKSIWIIIIESIICIIIAYYLNKDLIKSIFEVIRKRKI